MTAPQKCPASLKVGSILHSVIFMVEDTGRVSGTFYEEKVRSIRRKRNSSPDSPKYATIVTLIDGVTWLSKPPFSLRKSSERKKFQPGWASYIPEVYQKSFSVERNLPFGVYTTRLMAIKSAISDLKDEIAWYENELAGNGDDGKPEGEYLTELLREKDENERCLKAAKTALTKERNKRDK